jgi:hypothetical protein
VIHKVSPNENEQCVEEKKNSEEKNKIIIINGKE